MAQPDFKTLKERVGIDDAAYDLGYRVNRQAGVGRFIEMVLPDGSGGHTDSIVISNPKDKAAQYYFRHSAPGSGDVVSFIRENIGRFPDGGRNEWDTVGRVLCRLANEPVPEISSGSYLGNNTARQEFDPARWETQPMTEHLRNGMAFLTPRGFTVDTLKVFAPHIVRIRDRESQTFRDFNIGFPYREPGGTETVGYEIRGFNRYKSKAAGTNSSTAAWIVDFSPYGNPQGIRNVYFAESAYDIMAFYQANRKRIDTDTSVFVSNGGTFSDRQVRGIMDYYPNARAVCCFDNDLAGRIYDIRMAALLDSKDVRMLKTDEGVRLSVENKDVLLLPDAVSLTELGRLVRLSGKVRLYKPPKEFKDWNDVIMHRPWVMLETANKFQRDRNLAARRGGMKM